LGYGAFVFIVRFLSTDLLQARRRYHMPKIRIPDPWQTHTGGEALVEVSGQTVGAALDDLITQYPELAPEIFADGEVRSGTQESVNVLVGKFDFRELEGPSTTVQPSDTLIVLRTWPAAMSGPQGG
jgi:molybdopterin converting factor small subunit